MFSKRTFALTIILTIVNIIIIIFTILYSRNYLYEQACSGQLQQTPAEQRNLRCRYIDNDVPFCLIAPFKIEELNLDPYVAIYHAVIYESEIENIQLTTRGNFQKSTVFLTGEPAVKLDIRASETTSLENDEYEFLYNLEQRLEDITGLSIASAEHLKVSNYGIGDYYGPHYDPLRAKLIEQFDAFGGSGNRILTALFYLNDVELGGATTFPYLRLTVQPMRGSMIMWYNLHKSLEVDYRTLHAGCPVQKGSKTIATKWFHSFYQEFNRPCDYVADSHKSALHYYAYELYLFIRFNRFIYR